MALQGSVLSHRLPLPQGRCKLPHTNACVFLPPSISRSMAMPVRSVAGLADKTFLVGSYASLRKFMPTPVISLKGRKGIRAAQSDIPTFKGFPPMQTKPQWYWRIVACLPYIMPLCESWMYAETAYSLHCFIEQFEFLTYPVLRLLGKLPSWFLLAYFFVAYLGIVRKNMWPHFFRFHVVTGMLLEILLQVLGTMNDWLPRSLYWGKIGAHFWLALFFTFLMTVLKCLSCALSGMYADIPFISDAAYMQIPYE